MQQLPIDSQIPLIISSLRNHQNLIIEAAPGTGKTTRIPPAILKSQISNQREVWVLEPRRLATRLSAKRVAEELHEKLGETVGYQIRFEEISSPRTRLRFLTEGLLLRKLQGNPHLENVAVVILDEFHERNLHTDVSLAMLRKLQMTTRPDLKLVVMSATLDAKRIAKYLEDCPIIRVPGQNYEVEISYHADEQRTQEQRIALTVKSLITKGLNGHVLVFLPGAAEIRRARAVCEEIAARENLFLCSLHGELSSSEQDRALQFTKQRKIILATNVAETSVTIEGVAAVIDTGLARVAGHSPWSGLPTLTTQRISKAAAQQRAGRAGRTRAGQCLRLFSAMDFAARPDFETPEIQRLDLASVVLTLAGVGIDDPCAFPWFEFPAAESIKAAQKLLLSLGAVDTAGKITSLGKQMLRYPLHPRQARIFIEAAGRGVAKEGATVAALMSERSLRSLNFWQSPREKNSRNDVTSSSDLFAQIEQFRFAEQVKFDEAQLQVRGINANAARQIVKTREQLLNIWRQDKGTNNSEKKADEEKILLAILSGYPDRVAYRQASDNVKSFDVNKNKAERLVKMANGEFAQLGTDNAVSVDSYFVALDAEEQRAQSSGRSSSTIIRSVSSIESDWLLDLFPEAIVEENNVFWNEKSERVEVVSQMLYENLVLSETRLQTSKAIGDPDLQEKILAVLLQAVHKVGWEKFINAEEFAHLQARIIFAAKFSPQDFDLPVTSLELENICSMLALGKSNFAELRSVINIEAVKREFLTPQQLAKMNEIAPEFINIAGRKKIKVHYVAGQDPWIESRMQDFFGMQKTPAIANGRMPLVLHLLAPNQRAQQVTNDLAGFWTRTYPQVRRELSRRYPRHHWPENPLTFVAPNKSAK